MYNPFTLVGKTILVTGASSGIGRSIAIECSKLGAKLIIAGRNQTRLLDTFRNLSGPNHIMIDLDLKDQNAINVFLDGINPINGLVHAAGVTDNAPFQFVNRKKLDEIMEVNFYAPLEITRKVLKNKTISNGGSIIFISSISGIYTSSVALSAYSGSKGAINGFAKSLALELAPKNIRVNSINPGIVETDIFKSGIITNEQLEVEKQRYPLKRFGRPDEIAFAAVYLLSDASSWVTGSNLLIDGGFTLQ